MDLGLDGRRAAIGASSAGLGLGVAHALAAEGVRVAICGRDPERLARAAASFPPRSECVAITADLSTPEGATAFATAAIDRLGGVDIVVPNAGGPPAGKVSDLDVDAYVPALQENLLSVIALCRATVPAMRAQGWGRVLAITSATVREPAATLVLSNVARSGATAYLKTLAREVAADGVTVNALQPGLHATDRLTNLGVTPEQAAQAVPTRTVGDPVDFGRFAAFLCSDATRFVTGVSIPVDGGTFAGLQ